MSPTDQHHIVSLTEGSFDELITSTTAPVVVDFTAPWCPPCGPMTEALAQVAAEQAGRMVAATVNVDEEAALARRFGVMSMPTLLVFVDGQLVDRFVGARGPRHLLEELSRHL